MNVRTAMKILAVYYAIFLGLVWLVAPQTGLGDHPDANAEFVARVLGADLVAVGVVNWFIGSQSMALIRRVIAVNVFMNAVQRFSALSHHQRLFDAAHWVGVGAHTVPLVILLYYLTTIRSGRHEGAGQASKGPYGSSRGALSEQ